MGSMTEENAMKLFDYLKTGVPVKPEELDELRDAAMLGLRTERAEGFTREDYEKLRQRCLRMGDYHPETKELGTIGAIWADIYKRKHIRQPAAEMIVGYLSEFIDHHFRR